MHGDLIASLTLIGPIRVSMSIVFRVLDDSLDLFFLFFFFFNLPWNRSIVYFLFKIFSQDIYRALDLDSGGEKAGAAKIRRPTRSATQFTYN